MSGMEIFRVNYNNGYPIKVSKPDLQFKGNRNYFNETVKLHQNEIYFSPLDLNVEKGKIEYPLKPMIRIGMPMMDKEGQKIGIVLLNYLAEKTLEKIDNKWKILVYR